MRIASSQLHATMNTALQTGNVSETINVTAEAAVLHNGFSIRHERREVIGSMTRLYTSADGNSSFIDVTTSDIDHVEPDLSAVPPEVVVQPAAGSPLSAQPPAWRCRA